MMEPCFQTKFVRKPKIMGLVVATKAFFKLLFDRELSQSFQRWVDSGSTPKIAVEKVPPASTADTKRSELSKPVSPPKPSRSEALTLLAALQREARLIDIVHEPLDQYSDAQIGAAARDVLKNSGAVIERMFGLVPLTDSTDGSTLSTPAKFDPAQYRLIGSVTGSPPFTGTVAHHGWKATRCEVPSWKGQAESSLIVAPIELEVS
jgi:hypothetical protein